MLMALLISCVGLDAARELCFKQATMCAALVGLSAWVAVGIGVWVIELIIYASVLAHVPLNVAFPIMSLTYVASVLAGWIVLGEQVSLRRLAGTGFITAGVLLVGATGIA